MSKNGNDHIHIVASMVRDDGTKWNSWKSKYKSQQVARALEKKYGLTELEAVRAERGTHPRNRPKPPLGTARRRAAQPRPQGPHLRDCISGRSRVLPPRPPRRASRAAPLRCRPNRRGDRILCHRTATEGERAVWFGGNSLGRDLALPKLRSEWESSPETATAAVVEWNAAARNRRPVARGSGTLQPSAELWSKYANDVSALREKLATTPHHDHAAWAQAARETSAFGAWPKRIEPTPGPLTDAAPELSKSTQIRRYTKLPAVALPSARGATMILLAATSKSERAAYALMFRQLAQTARAIHDMHKATDDLRRVRGLAAAVTAASKAVEASATTQTSVRYSLGRCISPMAVAAYTYDRLPPSEQEALPDEGHVVAALTWTADDTESGLQPS